MSTTQQLLIIWFFILILIMIYGYTYDREFQSNGFFFIML